MTEIPDSCWLGTIMDWSVPIILRKIEKLGRFLPFFITITNIGPLKNSSIPVDPSENFNDSGHLVAKASDKEQKLSSSAKTGGLVEKLSVFHFDGTGIFVAACHEGSYSLLGVQHVKKLMRVRRVTSVSYWRKLPFDPYQWVQPSFYLSCIPVFSLVDKHIMDYLNWFVLIEIGLLVYISELWLRSSLKEVKVFEILIFFYKLSTNCVRLLFYLMNLCLWELECWRFDAFGPNFYAKMSATLKTGSSYWNRDI